MGHEQVIMENRTGILGSILAWLGTAWAVFEQHYGAIAALFAVAVSIATLLNFFRIWWKARKD